MQILPGNKIADQILEGIKSHVSMLAQKPKLGIVLAGENPTSEVYVKLKQEKAKQCGIESLLIRTSTNIAEIIDSINRLNQDSSVHGIILQLPVVGVDASSALAAIDPRKDVDGLNPLNLGRIFNNINALVSATPLAVLKALEYISINNESNLNDYLKGKNTVIINRSILFGKPLAALLLNLNATVTIAHSHTKAISNLTKNADIIISATGSDINLSDSDVKEGVIIIDAGYRIVNNKAKGDISHQNIQNKCSWITPVPGGIGPLGVAMLLENTLKASQSTL